MDEEQTSAAMPAEPAPDAEVPSAQEVNTKRSEAAAELQQEVDSIEERLGPEAGPLTGEAMRRRALR